MKRLDHGKPAEQLAQVHEGPAFVLPPRNRLFCAFHTRADAVAATYELLHLGAVHVDDVWVFEGEGGAGRLDPTIVGHSPRTTLGRLLQRLLTGDAAYGDVLVGELRRGGVVLAIHIARDDVSHLLPSLERHGGHSIAFGTHWNFLAPDSNMRRASTP